MEHLYSSHSIKLTVSDPIWSQLTRFSELTGFSRKEIILCILEEDLRSFFEEHPDLITE